MNAIHDARQAAELAARNSYGRLLAWLAYQWRDLSAAQDALGDALVKALERWPQDGVPAAPDAWLLSVARRELLQVARRQRLHDCPEVQALLEHDPMENPGMVSGDAIPDARLKLMFVCAHPAIDASVRTALMLQTVLGLDARRIASAFLLSPSAIAQRLVRAKYKISATAIRFEEPDIAELPERAHAVLEAIYAVYGLGWDAAPQADPELGQEAIFLAQLAVQLMPDSAEAKGLLALMLLSESRREARFASPDGVFVPLHEQDEQSWDLQRILAADRLLAAAALQQTPGPFQLEAAIQAAHCHRVFGHEVPWAAIAQLYERLQELSPSLGAQVSHAVACGEASGPADGLRLLDQIALQRVRDYQPYWVARGRLLRQLKQIEASREAYLIAIGLTADERVKRYLWAVIS